MLVFKGEHTRRGSFSLEEKMQMFSSIHNEGKDQNAALEELYKSKGKKTPKNLSLTLSMWRSKISKDIRENDTATMLLAKKYDLLKEEEEEEEEVAEEPEPEVKAKPVVKRR